MKRYIFLFSLICFLGSFQNSIHAQCDSDPGNINFPDTTLCFGDLIQLPYPEGAVIETGDTLLFWFHTNPNDPRTLYSFSYVGLVAADFNGFPIYVTAVAGPYDPNFGIDPMIPCLKFSNTVTIDSKQAGFALFSECEKDTIRIKSNGTPPFDYSVSFTPGDTTLFSTNEFDFFLGTQGDSVFIKMTNAEGCPTEDNVSTPQIGPVNCSLAYTDTLGCGIDSISVNFSCTGGTQPYRSIRIYNPDGEHIYSCLPDCNNFILKDPGMYRFEIRDYWDCYYQDSIYVFSNDDFSFAGELPLPDNYVICEETLTVPIPQNLLLGENDGLGYILHSISGNPLGSILISSAGSLTTSTNLMVGDLFGVNYLSSVVGDTLSNGTIDFTDPCLSTSKPVTILQEEMIAELGGYCFGEVVPVFLYGTVPISGEIQYRLSDGSRDTLRGPFLIPFVELPSNTIEIQYNLSSDIGCTGQGLINTVQTSLQCDLSYSDTLSCLNSETTLSVNCLGGMPPFMYIWSGPNGFSSNDFSSTVTGGSSVAGEYIIQIIDAAGCSVNDTINVKFDGAQCGFIEGNITIDNDNNCLPTGADLPIENIEIKASGNQSEYFGTTDASGNYSIPVFTGIYDVDVATPKYSSCPPPQQAIVANTGDIAQADMLIQSNCSSDAGTIMVDTIESCEISINLPIPQNFQLDSNDIMWYMVFTDLNDPFGSRRSMHRAWLPDETPLPIIGSPRELFVAAMVADSTPNRGINLDDVCLSISNHLTIVNNHFNVEVDTHCPGDSVPVIFNATPPISGWIVPFPFGDTMFIDTNITSINLSDIVLGFDFNLLSGEGCVAEGSEAAFTQRLRCNAVFSDTLSCLVEQINVTIECEGGTPPYLYSWNNGVSSSSFSVNTPGAYSITVSDANGCVIEETINIPFKDDVCGTISGTVLLDKESDCLTTPSDIPVDCWLVAAYGKRDTFYGTTNLNGDYIISVLPDTFDVQVILKNSYYTHCTSAQEIIVKDADDALSADFLIKKEIDCPLMEVSISVNRLRRCFDNNTMYVNYCNQGTSTAIDPTINIVLDPLLSLVSSVEPFTRNGDTLTFLIGDVAPLECRDFNFQFEVSCDATLGQTLCAEARIFPDSLCTATSPLWSKASLELDAKCSGDSIFFSVKNVGDGDMTAERQYIVIEDAAIMRVSNPFQLPSGEKLESAISPEGATIRIEVPQVDNHPGNSMPSVTLEGCGSSNFSIGFVNQLPNDDADPWIDIECGEVRGSYDPNDKAAVPKGFESAHYIEQNVDLEYKIRFQNTGTDTAFKVVILDTISHLLDISTLIPGAGSHNYSWQVFENGILEFTFEDILLVDSFTNEPASNGFVKYRISQMPDVELGSVIKNAADIYFDFNDPIYTNQTFHTVGKDFITVKTREIFIPGAEVSVFPNPFREEVQMKILNVPFGKKTLTLYDLSGKPVRKQVFDDDETTLKRNDLPGGIYFYKISREGTKIAIGKLVIQ